MSTLHIVRQSAFNTNDFAQCLQVLRDGDVITFVDDGCYNLHHKLISTVETNTEIELNVMEKHAQARAIAINKSLYTTINMSTLVELTMTTNRVITWQ
jgi:sulfur relay protein TusB/DsrH